MTDLLQTAPKHDDSAQREDRVRELIALLKAHSMADIKSLFESLRKLKLPEPRVPPQDLGARIKANFADDKVFDALLKRANAPKAYSGPEVIQIYNAALERNERFGKNASKKKILDQLRAEREIVLSNDQSRATIIAHSKGSKA